MPTSVGIERPRGWQIGKRSIYMSARWTHKNGFVLTLNSNSTAMRTRSISADAVRLCEHTSKRQPTKYLDEAPDDVSILVLLLERAQFLPVEMNAM